MTTVRCRHITLLGTLSTTPEAFEEQYWYLGFVIDNMVSERTCFVLLGEDPDQTILAALIDAGWSPITEQDFRDAPILEDPKRERERADPKRSATQPTQESQSKRHPWMDTLKNKRSVLF